MLWKHANYSSVKSNVVENIANHVHEKEIKENVKKTVDFLLNAIEDSENTPEERAVDTNENGQTIVTKTSNKEERRHYDYRFKLKVIEQVNDGNLAVDVTAPHHNISKSLVSRWLKNRKEITDQALNKNRQLAKRKKRTSKHDVLFARLYRQFVAAREKGKMVSYAWLYTKASIIAKQLYPGKPRLSKSAVWAFIKIRNVKMRRVQRKKSAPKTDMAPKLMQWHCTFRESVIKSGSSKPTYDPKYGRFKPENRINVDQVPLPFAIDRKQTYEPPVPKKDRKDHKVWVSNPKPGLEKRQCTLQVVFSPVANKMRLGIIFRGTGKRITRDETDAYHPDVDVYWQANAWADTRVCVEWVEKTLRDGVKDLDKFLLLCDNLEGQISSEFKEKVRLLEGLVWYGLKNGTEFWKPTDGGVGRILKVLIGQEQQEWLESDENLEMWMGNSEKDLNAKERRILITHWAGNSWEKMNTPEYKNLLFRCFQRTGCLITADCSDDDKGLVGYAVPPPLQTVSADDPIVQHPTPDDVPDDVCEIEEEAETVPEVNDDDLEDDKEADRDYSHNLVGRRIRALYNNGWFTGHVKYFNTRMSKLNITFSDDSDDYMRLDEINDTDVQLV